MPLQPCCVWVATLPNEFRVRSGRTCRRHYVNRRADTQLARDAIEGSGAGDFWFDLQPLLEVGAVVGVALVVLECIYHDALATDRSDREQHRIWQQELEDNLMQHVYGFRVLDSCLLAAGDLLQRCGNSKSKGFVNSLEVGQPNRLAQRLRARPQWLNVLPTIALRCCASHAVCFASGVWRRCWLPCFAEGRNQSFSIDWQLLGVALNDLPTLPAYANMDQPIVLSPENALEFADTLRSYIAVVGMEVNNGPPGADIYRCLSALQSYNNEMAPDHMVTFNLEVTIV